MSAPTFTEEYLRENFIRLNDVKLGADVKIYSFVNAYGCEIGDGRNRCVCRNTKKCEHR